MSEILRPGGFPENTPEIQVIENAFKSIIVDVFRSRGYIGIETPAIEKTSVLVAKGGDEVSKQIFGLYGLAQGGDDLKPYSLRFDLTVPLARYVLDHESEIRFPFKRYQIDKVWRGERQQKGRFKEFYQCDVDVIDEDLDINYDIEVIAVLHAALKRIFTDFKVSKNLEVHINNKNFIEALFNELGIDAEKRPLLYKLFDDFYKVSYDDFVARSTEILGTEGSARLLDIITKVRSNQDTPLSFVEVASCIHTPEAKGALQEVHLVYSKLTHQGINVQFDPFIMRGLDYYSGTVFETFITGHSDFGSICSGGRYDELVESIREKHTTNRSARHKKYGGVGGSIGLSRLLSRLLDAGFIDNKTLPLVETLVFNLKGESVDYREKIASLLRESGISAEVYYKDDKLKKQFDYAASKNIPFGIFVGEKEESSSTVTIKNLSSQVSTEVALSHLTSSIRSQLDTIL